MAGPSFDNTFSAFKAYEDLRPPQEEKGLVTDGRAYVYEKNDAMKRVADTLLKDMGEAVQHYKQTGEKPSPEMQEKLAHLKSRIVDFYQSSPISEMPYDLRAGFDKLYYLSLPHCVPNRQAAIDYLEKAPVGSVVIWPSQLEKGMFRFFQKLPADISLKNPELLREEYLKAEVNAVTLNFVETGKKAIEKYPNLEPGECVVWPSNSRPGLYSVILRRKDELFNDANIHRVEASKVRSTIKDLRIRNEQEQSALTMDAMKTDHHQFFEGEQPPSPPSSTGSPPKQQ